MKKNYIEPKMLGGFEVDNSSVIWRYLDMEKFKSLLETEALYFAAAQQFADRYEGSISHPHIALRKKASSRAFGSDLDAITRMEKSSSKAFQELTRLVKISCWHQNDFESAAMWELYLREGKGVVVKTTVDRLRRALGEYKIQPHLASENIWLGAVRYIDFDRDKMAVSMLDRFFFKRRSFSHENEIRVAISLRLAEEYGIQVPDGGIFVPVNLSLLIEEIRVAPELDANFFDEIVQLVANKGLNVKVNQSDMDRDPMF